MKHIKTKIFQVILFAVAISLVACNDYLGTIPKGEKIPKTWADYNAFIKNEIIQHREMGQAAILLNDVYKTQTVLNSNILTRFNYNWDENGNRITESNSDTPIYYSTYESIFYWNLIIDKVPEAEKCTEEERQMLIAQARMLRAMAYHHLANYYAKQYVANTADKDISIPLVTSSNLETPSPQVTVKKLYDFIIDELDKAVNYLPLVGETMFHPTRAAGYGMLARVYLSIGDYGNALSNASAALDINDALFDWKAYYEADKERFTDTKYVSICKPMAITNPENYIFVYGNSLDWQGIVGKNGGLSVNRVASFEKGDTRLLTHWKRREYVDTGEILYFGIHGELPNYGGIRAPEMYYIKAECLARKGDAANIQAAMDLVNIVRKTRILDTFYLDMTASTTKEAVEKILADKASEYIQTMVPYSDIRRLNQEPEYARTLTKTENGETFSLSPNSHLWIMPFPKEVIYNPGNGTIVQNTPK